jgi:hypothetical protein
MIIFHRHGQLYSASIISTGSGERQLSGGQFNLSTDGSRPPGDDAWKIGCSSALEPVADVGNWQPSGSGKKTFVPIKRPGTKIDEHY